MTGNGAGSGPPEQGTEMEERRKGMDDFDKRLQRVELIVRQELGDPNGKDGRLHEIMRENGETLKRIDESLRGNGDPGLTERVRNLEDFKRAGRKGDLSLIDRVSKLESNQRLIISGLGTTASGLILLAWEWVRIRVIGGGGS